MPIPTHLVLIQKKGVAVVSKELLEELGKILKRNYGLELSEDDLSEFSNALVQYFEVLTRLSSGGGQNG